MPSVNTFVWARDCETKELIERVGARYARGLSVRRVLDVGAGASEEIAELWPDADEYVFLDSFAWPPERPRYRCEGLTTLRPLQDDRSRLPDGRPLRALAGPGEARCFRSHSATLEACWGSFFMAFVKQG